MSQSICESISPEEKKDMRRLIDMTKNCLAHNKDRIAEGMFDTNACEPQSLGKDYGFHTHPRSTPVMSVADVDYTKKVAHKKYACIGMMDNKVLCFDTDKAHVDGGMARDSPVDLKPDCIIDVSSFAEPRLDPIIQLWWNPDVETYNKTVREKGSLLMVRHDIGSDEFKIREWGVTDKFTKDYPDGIEDSYGVNGWKKITLQHFREPTGAVVVATEDPIDIYEDVVNRFGHAVESFCAKDSGMAKNLHKSMQDVLKMLRNKQYREPAFERFVSEPSHVDIESEINKIEQTVKLIENAINRLPFNQNVANIKVDISDVFDFLENIRDELEERSSGRIRGAVRKLTKKEKKELREPDFAVMSEGAFMELAATHVAAFGCEPLSRSDKEAMEASRNICGKSMKAVNIKRKHHGKSCPSGEERTKNFCVKKLDKTPRKAFKFFRVISPNKDTRITIGCPK